MNNPSWAILFLVAGVLIIVFTFGRMMRRRREERSREACRDGSDEDTDISFDRHTDAVLSKRQLVEELERHLENRIHTLKSLIQEADSRIEMLRRGEEVESSRPSSASHLSENPDLSLNQRIKELAADGLSPREIAEDTGLGAAEVRLALHLIGNGTDGEASKGASGQEAAPGEEPDEAEG